MSKNLKTTETEKKRLTFLEAEKFLRKIDEWHDVSHLDRDTIIKWAEFLLSKESK